MPSDTPPEPDHHRRFSDILVAFVYFLGVSWPFVLAFSGVSSDTVQIPFGYKVLLTVGSMTIPLLLIQFGRSAGTGCGCLLGVFCIMGVCVMWYWN